MAAKKHPAILLLRFFFWILAAYTIYYGVVIGLAFFGLISVVFIEEYLYLKYVALCYTYAGGKEGARRLHWIKSQRRGEYFVVAWWIYYFIFLIITTIMLMTENASKIDLAALKNMSNVLLHVTLALIATTVHKRWKEVVAEGLPKTLLNELIVIWKNMRGIEEKSKSDE